MSASRSCTGSAKLWLVQYRGKVIQKPFGQGSKSEHDAVYLVTDEGEYVLRRAGGNPFRDPELDALGGKEIVCEGTSTDHTLIVSEWRETGS